MFMESSAAKPWPALAVIDTSPQHSLLCKGAEGVPSTLWSCCHPSGTEGSGWGCSSVGDDLSSFSYPLEGDIEDWLQTACSRDTRSFTHYCAARRDNPSNEMSFNGLSPTSQLCSPLRKTIWRFFSQTHWHFQIPRCSLQCNCGRGKDVNVYLISGCSSRFLMNLSRSVTLLLYLNDLPFLGFSMMFRTSLSIWKKKHIDDSLPFTHHKSSTSTSTHHTYCFSAETSSCMSKSCDS